MKKTLKKIRTVCVVSVMSVSLCFSSVTVSYYQAAALAPAVWTLIEILFVTLGYTVFLEEAADKAEIDDRLAADIEELSENIQDGTKKGPLLELADYIGNIHRYWEPVTGLTVPQTVWETLKFYLGVKQEARQYCRPLDADINLYGCSQEQYLEFFSSYFNLSLTDGMEYFLQYSYPLFLAADYSFIIRCHDGAPLAFFGLDTAESYYFMEQANGGNVYLYPVSAGGKNDYLRCSCYYLPSTDGFARSDLYSISYPYYDLLFMVKGRIYELADVCSVPGNTTMLRDYGSTLNIEDFLKPSIAVCTGVGVIDNVTDIPIDDRDVLTPGREWDEEENKVVGDVVLGIPSQNALDDYYNGLITWEELMEKIGAEPVDTSTDMDRPLDETGRPKEEEGTSENIIDVVLGIPDAIMEGLTGLFIPRNGFIEDKLAEIMRRVRELGIVPYDMGELFGGDGNPFQDIVIEIYGQEVVIVSFKYLPMFLDKFRPAIRGLMALFMLYYCVNQFLGLLGLAGIIQGGNSNKLDDGNSKETGVSVT